MLILTLIYIAKSHFSAALDSQQSRAFVRKLQLSARRQARHGSIVKIEFIKVAQEILQQEGTSNSMTGLVFFEQCRTLLHQPSRWIKSLNIRLIN